LVAFLHIPWELIARETHRVRQTRNLDKGIVRERQITCPDHLHVAARHSAFLIGAANADSAVSARLRRRTSGQGISRSPATTLPKAITESILGDGSSRESNGRPQPPRASGRVAG